MNKQETIENTDKDLTIRKNMAVITIGYDKFIMPYENGLTVMNAFKQAERIETSYSNNIPTKIKSLGIAEDISLSVLSEEVYKTSKLKYLLIPPAQAAQEK